VDVSVGTYSRTSSKTNKPGGGLPRLDLHVGGGKKRLGRRPAEGKGEIRKGISKKERMGSGPGDLRYGEAILLCNRKSKTYG